MQRISALLIISYVTFVHGSLLCKNLYIVTLSSSSGDVKSKLEFGYTLENILNKHEWTLELSFSADVDDFNVNHLNIIKRGIEIEKELSPKDLNITRVTDFRSFILQRYWSRNTSLDGTGNLNMKFEFTMKSREKELQLIHARLNNHTICTSHGHWGCGLNAEESQLLIAHGREINYTEWPWITTIFLRHNQGINFRCGGSLVSARHVITAAHCIVGKNGHAYYPEELIVYLGKHLLTNFEDKEPEVQSFSVSNIYIHNEWQKIGNDKKDADIAIIVLTDAATFTDAVQPVCLFGNPVTNATIGDVIGWGLDETGQPSQVPKIITMPAVTGDECEESNSRFVYEKIVSNRTFCAGKRDGSGPCKGDSGGGFFSQVQYIGDIKRHYLSGIVSRSLSNKDPRNTTNEYVIPCDLDQYVVFTDILSYRTWIECILYNQNCPIPGVETSHLKLLVDTIDTTTKPGPTASTTVKTSYAVAIVVLVIVIIGMVTAFGAYIRRIRIRRQEAEERRRQALLMKTTVAWKAHAEQKKEERQALQQQELEQQPVPDETHSWFDDTWTRFKIFFGHRNRTVVV